MTWKISQWLHIRQTFKIDQTVQLFLPCLFLLQNKRNSQAETRTSIGGGGGYIHIFMLRPTSFLFISNSNWSFWKEIRWAEHEHVNTHSPNIDVLVLALRNWLKHAVDFSCILLNHSIFYSKFEVKWVKWLNFECKVSGSLLNWSMQSLWWIIDYTQYSVKGHQCCIPSKMEKIVWTTQKNDLLQLSYM